MMKLEVTLKKSLIGRRPNQVRTAKALGLKKVNQVVVKEDNDAIRGMIRTIQHMVSVTETE
jgi:large subunit ribosomal protein L30